LSDLNDVTGRSWEAELYRQRAQFLLARSGTSANEAESCLKEALVIARRQSAKSLELQAATTLATLWQIQERFDEARGLIEPIYNWFSEGTDTADLRSARVVRDALN
jgi:predicted ATPase